ncbi:Shedu immune nuclease family protein [Amycolatopsis japonica]|uniref:Shedu immune nuclease family protein n=1 Tax=Amycolatopsis japonica TaxID=208439 RepID=UPI0033EEFBB6
MVTFADVYQRQDEFPVATGDFSSLEIRNGGKPDGFHYFFDTRANRLITDFVIDDRPRVATLMQVTIIRKDEGYSPRIRLWKRDKSKGNKVLEHEVSETEQTKVIKATVDAGDSPEANQNFWKVIRFLESFIGLTLPDDSFRVITKDIAQLAESLEGQDKETILRAVHLTIGSSLTEADLRLMSNRKAQLDVFARLLNDEGFFSDEQAGKRGPEAVWQAFFEENSWIFGYGLKLVACESLVDGKLERITTGANIFSGAGKRSDAVMRTKGYVSSLLFCEIKTHKKPLLESKPYRPPDVFQVSSEVTGGVAQVQKTADKALRAITKLVHEMYEDDGTPMGIQLSTVRPRQALVIGSLQDLTVSGQINPEKASSFEMYRNAIRDVEIITFDELYERASFIVKDYEKS